MTRRLGAVAAPLVCALALALLSTPSVAPTAAGAVQPTAAGATAATAAPAAPAATGPNVVVVTVDDMRTDELRHMPITRRLIGRQGTTYANAYAPFPLCCPSRTGLLTGQFPHNHGVMGNTYETLGGYRYYDEIGGDQNAVNHWLRAGGYRTAMVGKFLNLYGQDDPTEVPSGWDTWNAAISGRTFNIDGVVGFRDQHNITSVTELALETMAPDDPFFTWVSYSAPHTERRRNRWVPPSPLPEDATTPVTLPVIPVERDLGDKPPFYPRKQLGPRTRAHITELRTARARSLIGVDRAVGEIVEHLDAQGILDDTIVVFHSDNGFVMGEHNIPQGKTLPYEVVTRVPLLMRGPGVPVGTTATHPVAIHDITATIVEETGIQPGRELDGVSLIDVARRPWRYHQRPMLYESGNVLGLKRTDTTVAPGRRFFTAIRYRGWVYIRYVTGDSELYDLRSDPDQLTSLHRDPAYADVRRQLRAALVTLRACAGAACNVPVRLQR